MNQNDKKIKTLSLGKNISILCTGIIAFIISLVLFIKSFENYFDGYGHDISFEENYAIGMIIGIIIISCFGYILYKEIKGKEEEIPVISMLSGFLVSTLVSFYSLGICFKNIFKDKPWADYCNYLYIGLFALGFVVYYVFKYLLFKEEEQK